MSAFAQAFLRTGRAALARGSYQNPVQRALGVNGSVKYTAACRNYATAFERSKPHVNIGIYFKYINSMAQLLRFV